MFPCVESQHHIIDPANLCRALDDGIEHRLHVRRRAADDAEHLGRCRLMLQRLAQLCVALLQFFKQSHVFNRYHGLVSEGLEKSDLLLGKGVNLQATNQNSPDCNSFTEQWRSQPGPNSDRPSQSPVFWKLGLCFRSRDIMDVDSLAVDNGPGRK